MVMSSKQKQDQRKAEMQAAAERDGFETWSQALTAWKNGEARLTKVAADWRVRRGLKVKFRNPPTANATRSTDPCI